MNLKTYIDKKGRGALTHLQKLTGVAYSTIHRGYRGLPMSYETARKVCIATDGLVSIDELCSPESAASAPDEPESADAAGGGEI